jgi:hypothetical protein
MENLTFSNSDELASGHTFVMSLPEKKHYKCDRGHEWVEEDFNGGINHTIHFSQGDKGIVVDICLLCLAEDLQSRYKSPVEVKDV